MDNPGYQVGDLLLTHHGEGTFAVGGVHHLLIVVNELYDEQFAGTVLSTGANATTWEVGRQYNFGYRDWTRIGKADPSAPD